MKTKRRNKPPETNLNLKSKACSVLFFTAINLNLKYELV